MEAHQVLSLSQKCSIHRMEVSRWIDDRPEPGMEAPLESDDFRPILFFGPVEKYNRMLTQNQFDSSQKMTKLA